MFADFQICISVPLKSFKNYLWISSSIMKLRDANLQVNEKSSFTHPPSCTLSSFSKNTSRLLLPRSLWKRANTICFRKYERVTCNVPVQYNSSKSTFSMLDMQHLVLGQLTPRKIAPQPKTNPNPNPNTNRGAILLGDNFLVDPQP